MRRSHGIAQSVLIKLKSKGSAITLWQWIPAQDQEAVDQETVAIFTALGYRQVAKEIGQAGVICLLSQCSDVEYIPKLEQEPKSLEWWTDQWWARAEDIEHVDPVILAFALPEVRGEMETITTLQFLPPPQLGEYAIVMGEEVDTTYNVTQLPEKDQVIWRKLGDALRALAAPGEWIRVTAMHARCSIPSDYQRMVDIETARILQSSGEARAKHEIVLEQIHVARKHIEAIQQAELKADWSHQWEEIQRMAKELATAYWTLHQSQQEKPLPEVANVFHDGISQVITSLPFQAYPHAAIARKDDWEEVRSTQEYEVILAHRYSKPGGTTSVQLRGDATGKTREMVLAALREQINKLSDLHSDFFWAMVAQLCKGPRDADGNAWITVQQLLDYRGISKEIKKENGRKRPAGHRQEDKFGYSQIISSMENTWVKVDNLEIIDNEAESGKSKKRGRSRITRESRLFMFGDIIYHQELSMDGTPGRRYPIAWQYRESSWMIPFLEGPNRFTAILLEKTLNYDPRNNFWEKRLAKYFMVYFRTNASKRNRPIKIQELFEECNLPTQERYPQRTHDRFEKAMNTLREDGHLLSWDYQEQRPPPARNWLMTWLNYHIIVEAPQQTKDQYLSIKTHAQALRLQQGTPRNQRRKKPGKTRQGKQP